jgi:hypothetical protein
MKLRNVNLRLLTVLMITTLRAAGLALLCVGVYDLVRVDPFATMSASIASQGYIVAGLYIELAAVMVSAFQHRMGRIVLVATSVGFLEAAFIWTSSRNKLRRWHKLHHTHSPSGPSLPRSTPHSLRVCLPALRGRKASGLSELSMALFCPSL